jgi:hypothetical protein
MISCIFNPIGALFGTLFEILLIFLYLHCVLAAFKLFELVCRILVFARALVFLVLGCALSTLFLEFWGLRVF